MADKIDKKIYRNGYQSEIDRFFHEFDEKRTEMPISRINEVRKHAAIFKKRDNKVEPEQPIGWDKF